ncbi:MAG: signal peptidase II [Planctomycetota bacterium]
MQAQGGGRRGARELAFWVAVIAGVLLDQVSKFAVAGSLELNGYVTILPGFLRFTYITNTGTFWGNLRGYNTFFVGLSFAALAFILYLRYIAPPRGRWLGASLALILAGAFGNLIDRIAFGCVRDFIDCHVGERYHWPVFNIADSLICVGLAIYIAGTWGVKSEPAPTGPPAEGSPEG